MLTRRQDELLRYLKLRLASGSCPSYDEMKDALGLRSKSGIHRMICDLEKRGFIKRLPEHARALELTTKAVNGTAEAEVIQGVAAIADSGYRGIGAYARTLEALLTLARKHGVDTGHVLSLVLEHR